MFSGLFSQTTDSRYNLRRKLFTLCADNLYEGPVTSSTARRLLFWPLFFVQTMSNTPRPRNYTVNRILGLLYSQEFQAAAENPLPSPFIINKAECEVLRKHIEWLFPGFSRRKLPKAKELMAAIKEEQSLISISQALYEDIAADDPELRRTFEALVASLRKIVGVHWALNLVYQSHSLYDPIYIVPKYIGLSTFIELLMQIRVAREQIVQAIAKRAEPKPWSSVKPMDPLDYLPILKREPMENFNRIRPFIVLFGKFILIHRRTREIIAKVRKWIRRPSSDKLKRWQT
jgi:hypothetical protein